MSKFFGFDVGVDDKDLRIFTAIVNRVCRSMDGMSKAVTEVAKSIGQVAAAVKGKTLILK